MELQHAAERLEALGNVTRLAVYRMLVRAGPDGITVGEIQTALGVPASTLSHHLRRLIAVGLMTQERRGVMLVCRANYPVMDGLVGFLTAECCLDVQHDAA